MIKNTAIIDKIKEKTRNNAEMQEFLLDIVHHENENSQYTKQYEKLIKKAVKGRGND